MLDLIIEVTLVTASGALSPGPLTLSAAMLGMKKGWKAGLLEAVGHMMIEFPLVLAIAMGAIEITRNAWALRLIGVIGGVALLIFSALTLIDLVNTIRGKSKSVLRGPSSPLIAGLTFTALNPYFIIWWATIGLKLVTDILVVGGMFLVVLLYPVHVWMDYAWLSLIAFLSNKGKSLEIRVQVAIMFTFTIVLAYYGIKFLLDSIIGWCS